MKKYRFIALFFFFNPVFTNQTNDSFSDGDFINSPMWSGTTTHFIVNTSQQLQLSNSVSGTSFLSTDFSPPSLNNVEWRAYVRQAFAPSGSNFSRIYLVSDQDDLTLPLNGYYIQFGEAGSNDALELFRQEGTHSTSVCRATNGMISNSFALRMKVTRNDIGLWKLLVDYSGEDNFVLECSGTDNTFSTSRALGILCQYTSSNASKFYFDDIYGGPLIVDSIPPTLLSVHTTSANELILAFSESLDQFSAERLNHYLGNQGLGNPSSVDLQDDNKSVNLFFQQAFKNGVDYQLTINGVTDTTGNVMLTVKISFLFFVPTPVETKDVIITEILADPIPSMGLPENEFIEIFNRSKNPINLGGWTLSDGNSTATFPEEILLPQKYRIITSTSFISAFLPFGDVTGLIDFPSLNNSGDYLVLKLKDGLLIDSVNYSITWFSDSDKAEGGWSLELIDPANPCGEEDNWSESDASSGGSPGKQNSVNSSKPDFTGPVLLDITPRPDTILLTFNEKLATDVLTTGSFLISPDLIVDHPAFSDKSLKQIELILSTPLETRQLYTLSVHGVRDCNGNTISEGSAELSFALPEIADSLDVLINEVLFNPRPGGVDFIEVYNNSLKYINLKGWKFGNMENTTMINGRPITNFDLILAPHTYRAFTPNSLLLANNYPQSNESNFFLTELPALQDDAGSIALVSTEDLLIDHFFYTKNFHSPLIKDEEGVSLERISCSTITNDPQNWKSASSQSGFATPGGVNSNARPENIPVTGTIHITPEIFEPESGSTDFAKINYAFDRSGYAANIRILDQQGRSLKLIANNETLGFEGFFRWDGDRDDGRRARTGYYIVWFEVFDLSGSVQTFRKRIILATH